MELLIASNNPGKQAEMAAILSSLGVQLRTPKELGIRIEVEENGTTYQENAQLKAQALCKATGLAAVADDSGLEVSALGGRPGLYSARYGGDGLSDRERTALLLREMQGQENRAARFVCAIACVFPDGSAPVYAWGECPGRLLTEERGNGGFGYDPIFFLEEKNATLSELTEEEKNRCSHRARALESFAQKLKERIADDHK